MEAFMKAFFQPASVVLIGVSRQTGVGAYNNLEMLLRYGYQGKIYLVHPQAPEILGYQAYARVGDLPEVPELAVVSLARDRVVPVVEECLARGMRRFVVISQGFADADPQGRDLQAHLVSLMRSHQALLVGPNTMGSMDAFTGFTSAFVDVKREPDPPPVSLVAQSGALQVGQESFTGPLGKALDLGNAADVGFTEVLEYFEHDPQTRVIVLHMEGLAQGRRFLEVAHRVNRMKPILVLKTGSSTAGAQAALSHTGSLVGQDAVFAAAFQRAGITRARGAADLVDKVQAFRKLPARSQRPPHRYCHPQRGFGDHGPGRPEPGGSCGRAPSCGDPGESRAPGAVLAPPPQSRGSLAHRHADRGLSGRGRGNPARLFGRSRH